MRHQVIPYLEVCNTLRPLRVKGAPTHLQVVELLGVVQAEHSQLQPSAMTFGPATHGGTQTLAGFQGANGRVELCPQPGAGSLQGAVGALNVTHHRSRLKQRTLMHMHGHTPGRKREREERYIIRNARW